MKRYLIVSAVIVAALAGCSEGGAPSAKPSPTPGSYVRGGTTYVRGEVGGLPAGPGIDMQGYLQDGLVQCSAPHLDTTLQKRCMAGAVARHMDLPECAAEDDNSDCYWDAWSRGNRAGNSFIVWDGTLYDLVDATQRPVG